MSLAELERAFWTSVRTRGAPPPGLSRIFTAGAHQSAAERVGIYHVAYWQRQLLSLASTFPRLRASLGEQRFERYALRYIELRPALHPCIERLGEGLPDFLATNAELSTLEVGLARLEWANMACLLARDARSVELPRALGARFVMCRLEMSPALLVVRAPAAAVRAFDEQLELDAHLTEVGVVFARPAFSVRYAALDEDEASALAQAHAGQDIARICEAFSSHRDATQRAMEVIGGWFDKRWVAGVHLAEDGVITATAPA